MNKPLLLAFASVLALGACHAAVTNNGAQGPQESQQQNSGLGINPSWMDKSVSPGDDFFSYADGTWVKNTPIPADRSSIGAFFIADQLREKNTRALFDDLLKSNPTTGTNALIANYYNAYFNTDAIDKA